MKKILYLFIISTLVLGSCKSRKKEKKVEEEVVTEVVKQEPKEVTEIQQEEKKETIIIMSLSKSVCFGECAAFNAQVYGNGIIVYEGIKNVARIGKFKGKMDIQELRGFMNYVSEMGFFKLKDTYDNKNVTDLPTAITYINFEGKKKKVVCRFECDDIIIKVNKMFEALLDKAAMKSYE